jgi:hypothetical protein
LVDGSLGIDSYPSWRIGGCLRSFGTHFLPVKMWPGNRVARWFIFKPKISIWVNFWGP